MGIFVNLINNLMIELYGKIFVKELKLSHCSERLIVLALTVLPLFRMEFEMLLTRTFYSQYR